MQWAATLRGPGVGRHGRSSGESRALSQAPGRVQRGVRRREGKGERVLRWDEMTLALQLSCVVLRAQYNSFFRGYASPLLGCCDKNAC